MAYSGIKVLPLSCAAATELVRYRFVDITKSTLTAAYSAAQSTPDGVTLAKASADGSAYIVAVQPLSDQTSTFFIDLLGTVSKGDELFATTSGQAVTAAHDDIVDRGKQADTPSSPSSGDKYIVPAADWASDSGNANNIAVYTTAWAFTTCDTTTNVGIVVFVVDEGRYVQWNGSSWAQVEVAAYANQAGITGQTIEVYKNPKRTEKPAGYRIKTCARITPSATGTTLAIKDVNIAATDEVFSEIIAQSGTVYIVKAVPTAGTLTLTMSSAYTTNDTFSYMAVEPYGATA